MPTHIERRHGDYPTVKERIFPKEPAKFIAVRDYDRSQTTIYRVSCREDDVASQLYVAEKPVDIILPRLGNLGITKFLHDSGIGLRQEGEEITPWQPAEPIISKPLQGEPYVFFITHEADFAEEAVRPPQVG